MAYEIANNSLVVSGIAGADLSGAQYKFVKMSADNTVVVCSAATDLPIGVLQNAPKSGEEATVLVSGGTKLILGGTVAAGAVVSTSAGAVGVAIVFGTDVTKYALGQAFTGGVSGDVITAIVQCANAGRAA